MRILLLSPWRNVWVDYMQRYFNSKGHILAFSKFLDVKDVKASDVVICGWADDMAAVLGKNQKLAKKYVLFVRSYEYYHNLVNNINYKNFDHIFFLNTHIMNQCFKAFDNIKSKSFLTKNALPLEKFHFIDREQGKNVLFLANINHKKGISLLVQIIRKMPDYRFYIVGGVQELRFYEYLKENMRSNVTYLGYQADINAVMKNMHYILCTSPAEGNPNNIIEGMATGLKPVIHKYLGYEGQFPSEYCFHTVDEAIEIITSNVYMPSVYRKYIEDNYDMNKVYLDIEKLLIDEKKEAVNV